MSAGTCGVVSGGIVQGGCSSHCTKFRQMSGGSCNVVSGGIVHGGWSYIALSLEKFVRERAV
jgi:hypothetical protein